MQEALEQHLQHVQKNKRYARNWPDPKEITVNQLEMIAGRIKNKKPLFRDIKPPKARGASVINPETGRKLMTGTKTYERLVKAGKIQPPAPPSGRVTIGVQTDPTEDVFQIPVKPKKMPSGKMTSKQKGELINNVNRLLVVWCLFKEEDPRELEAAVQFYLLDVVDACVYYCQKNKENIKALCGDDIKTERIFNYVKGLQLYNPMVNRCKRYLEECDGKYQSTEMNYRRVKVPFRWKKVLRSR